MLHYCRLILFASVFLTQVVVLQSCQKQYLSTPSSSTRDISSHPLPQHQEFLVHFFFDIKGLQYRQNPIRSQSLITDPFILEQQQYHYWSHTWIPQIIKYSNDLLKPHHIRLKFAGIHMWNSSNGRVELALNELQDHLQIRAQEISQKNNAHSRIKRQPLKEHPTRLWVGITSFSPPSYPKITDWIYSQYLSPYVVMRHVQDFKLSTQQQIAIQSHFFIRAIGTIFGGVSGCQTDWMSASRSQLKRGIVFQKNKKQVPVSDRKKYKSLSWSTSNQNLIKWHINRWRQGQMSLQTIDTQQACMLKNELNMRCISQLKRYQLYADICYQDPQNLMRDDRKNRFNTNQWMTEKQMAQGFVAWQNKAYQKAFDLCAPIANQKPYSYAPKCAGNSALALKNYTLAVKYFRAYLSTHLNDIEVLIGLSKALGFLQDHEGALANLKQALIHIHQLKDPIEKSKLASQVWYNLGVAYAKLNQIQLAVFYWKKIDEKSPQYAESLKLIQYFQNSSQ